MGLFKFFKKSDKAEKNPLIAQAYNATAPASPPKRGKIPVRGNGPVSLQTLQESLTRKADSSFTSLSIDNDAPAPPPAVPRFRAGSIDRPTTAPHSHSQPPSHSGSGSRPASRSTRRESILGPPLSFRKPRGESCLPQKQKSFDSSHSSRMAVGFSVPQPEFSGRDRAMSIQSTGTAGSRHFVDILDAQSEFRPTNFHSRIRASGVKDYGEDVADRNITVNGVDLSANLGQTFYVPVFDSAPSPVVARTTHHDEDLPRRRRRSHGRISRSMSIKSQHAEAAQHRHEQRKESMDLTKTSLALPKTGKRSMTLASYAPPLPSEPRRERRRHRSESMYIANTAKDAEFLNALADQLRPRTSYDDSYIMSQENISSFTSAMEAQPPERFREKSERRAKKDRRAAKSVASTLSANPSPGACMLHTDQSVSQRGASDMTSNSDSRTIAKNPCSKFTQAPVHSEPDADFLCSEDNRLESQVQDALDMRGDIAAIEPCRLADERREMGASKLDGTLDGLEGIDDGVCPPPSVRTSIYHHYRGASHGSFSRTRTSLMTSPATSEVMEDMIHEHVPGHHGEIRQWSISSTGTPPTTGSSAASMRPQSGHTANTSIDASKHQQEAACYGLPSDAIAPTKLSAPTGTRPSPAYGAADIPPRSPQYALPNFNIDDYVSSDEDSDGPMGPQRPRGEGEEALLFKDFGYGSMQLPGLFDSISQGAETGTATPVPGDGSDKIALTESLAAENDVGAEASTSSSANSEHSQLGDMEEQSIRSSPYRHNRLGPSPPSVPEETHARRSSHVGSLRHAASAPAVRRHSAFGGSAYSSSEYAEDSSPRVSRPSTSGNQRSSSKGSQTSIPPIPPRRRPVSMIIPAQPIPHVSEESEEASDSASASDFEEEDRHFRAEFARHAEAERHVTNFRPHASPAYVPPALQAQYGPVLRIPITAKPPTPDTRKPTLPSHQTDEENVVLPVHQIQMPRPPRANTGSVAHALERMRYSPVSMHSSSSESLGNGGARAPGMAHSRHQMTNSPIPESPEESVVPLPRGYAYGHGGAKYGNGYGFIRVLPEQNSRGSLPSTPTEERESFFGARSKKLGRSSVSRSDSRTSIHSERAREIVRRFKTEVGDE